MMLYVYIKVYLKHSLNFLTSDIYIVTQTLLTLLSVFLNYITLF